MTADEFKFYTDIAVNIITFFVAPIGAFGIYSELKRERKLREEEATEKRIAIYEALKAEYTQFQVLCLQNPDLREIGSEPVHSLGDDERSWKLGLLYSVATSMSERAFLLYRSGWYDRPTPIPIDIDGQWRGWQNWIEMGWLAIPEYVSWWRQSPNTWDPVFVDWMNDTIARVEAARRPSH